MDQDLHRDCDTRRSFQLHHGDAQMRHRVQAMYRFEAPAETVFGSLLQRLDRASASGHDAAGGDMASADEMPADAVFKFAARR